MLKYQIVQDLKQQRGLAVIDPHGDLASEILNCIPNSRLNDVIYFNPADYLYPIGINLLQLPESLEGDQLIRAKDLRTEAMISVLRKLFRSDSEEMGHRIEYILRNSIQTAFSVIKPDLFTIFKLLNDKSYNQRVVSTLKDPYLKLFWRQEIGRAGDMQRVKMQAGITAKIGRFLFSNSVRKCFSRPIDECLDFQKIINRRQILICNFSKGLLGEDASRLFGATVLAKLQLATLEQVQKSMSKRPAFYLYADEFQHFATSSFLEMLSEARKYGLNLIMAQQSMRQQTDANLMEVILANVGNLIVFKTGSPRDAQSLLPLFAPFLEIRDLLNLPAFHFYARLNALQSQIPTSGITKLLEAKPNLEIAKRVIRVSRANYATKDT